MRSWWILLALVLPSPAWSQAQPTAVQATVEDPRLDWRSARWGCLIGGGVALALGAVSFTQGLDDEAAIEDAERDSTGLVTGLTQREALRLQDSAGRAKTLGAVGIGLGAGLIAGGIVLWALEPPAPKVQKKAPEPTVRPFSFVPSITPEGPGFVLGTTF